ncbi:MAG: hypothetical protein ABIE22_04235 [archaeon]
MKFNFITKTLIVSVVFTILLYLFPESLFINNVSDLFTAVALLFGIISGFFIAATLNNYFRLQSLVADETAGLISIYKLVMLLSPKLKKQINRAIDNYLIDSFDHEFEVYVDKTWDEFDEICNVVSKVKKRETDVYSQLINTQNNLIRIRQEMTLTGRRIIGLSHWITLVVLAVTTIFLLFVMNEPTLESSIFTVLLSSTTCLVLFLLYEIDSNYFAEEQIAFSVYRNAFRELGNIPYYSELDIKKRRIKLPKKGVYRLGEYVNYPKSLEKKIKLINKNG